MKLRISARELSTLYAYLDRGWEDLIEIAEVNNLGDFSEIKILGEESDIFALIGEIRAQRVG